MLGLFCFVVRLPPIDGRTYFNLDGDKELKRMPEMTPHISLKKPLESETADISVINDNMDRIDSAFGDLASVPTEAKYVAGAIIELHEAIQEFDVDIPNGSITPAKLSFDPATQTELDDHANSNNVHSATSAAMASRLIIRDAVGRAKVAPPDASDDIARLDSITKAQAGLGNVDNYGTATQTEAEAGTATNKFMTPQRTKQAIDKLTGSVPLRVNTGKLEYYDGTGWLEVGGDPTLTTYFGHLGSFPFAGTADVVIAANTSWSDSKGYRKVKKLTINAGLTLKIEKSPFVIFAEEIVFGSTTSTIDISGANGSVSGPSHSDATARGGEAIYNSVRYAHGGCGGGMLIIVARKISGAAGRILANGGDGWANTTVRISNGVSSAGENAIAGLVGIPDVIVGATSNRAGSYGLIPISLNKRIYNMIGRISASNEDGSNNYNAGWGIGSGGGVATSGSASTYSGVASSAVPQPTDLICLAQMFDMKGGGGGAAYLHTTNGGDGAGAAGGGGGAIVVFANSISGTPTLQANGGIGMYGGPGGGSSRPVAGNGGAGRTHIVLV